MAHELDMSNGQYNFAYVGDMAWHGKGQKMRPDSTEEEWTIKAGLAHGVRHTPVMYNNHNGELVRGEGSVLFRDDTGAQLGVVSDRYKSIQPKDVAEFNFELCRNHGFTMETMGSLSGGKRLWALAKTGEGFTVGKNDRIETYLMLATSYDKSMATRAMFTSVRVVCHNTLTMAVADKKAGVSISHSAMFDADKVKLDLGIIERGNAVMADSFKAMADRKVSDKEAVEWIAKILFDIKKGEEPSTKARNLIQGVFGLYNGKGKGSGFETAHGTAFGLLNAITEHVDHHSARNANNRLQSAWFGAGDTLKNKAYTEALALCA
jgi:phage/plasmid-like protein (TIGR03299 family)